MSLPEFGLVVSVTRQRLAGALEEAEVAGTRFVKVTPPGHSPILVNPDHLVAIYPCDESQAKAAAARQFRSSN